MAEVGFLGVPTRKKKKADPLRLKLLQAQLLEDLQSLLGGLQAVLAGFEGTPAAKKGPRVSGASGRTIAYSSKRISSQRAKAFASKYMAAHAAPHGP